MLDTTQSEADQIRALLDQMAIEDHLAEAIKALLDLNRAVYGATINELDSEHAIQWVDHAIDGIADRAEADAKESLAGWAA